MSLNVFSLHPKLVAAAGRLRIRSNQLKRALSGKRWWLLCTRGMSLSYWDLRKQRLENFHYVGEWNSGTSPSPLPRSLLLCIWQRGFSFDGNGVKKSEPKRL
jgi:hypothetical protein